jgi:hypothetical protein
LINSIKVFQLAENDVVPPPVNKVADLHSAGENAQGIGGGRTGNGTISMGDATLQDKGKGGRGGSGGGGGGGNNGARRAVGKYNSNYLWLCLWIMIVV